MGEGRTKERETLQKKKRNENEKLKKKDKKQKGMEKVTPGDKVENEKKIKDKKQKGEEDGNKKQKRNIARIKIKIKT